MSSPEEKIQEIILEELRDFRGETRKNLNELQKDTKKLTERMARVEETRARVGRLEKAIYGIAGTAVLATIAGVLKMLGVLK